MGKATSFNPHWIDGRPAWDVRLQNGSVHRSVKESEILKLSSRRYPDIVRVCDIQDYGDHHLHLEQQPCPAN